MRFGVLGPVVVYADGVETLLGASRERTVLAVLLLAPNRVVPVERLVDAVWGENPPATARGQLHTCVSRLRRELGTVGAAVVTDPAGYRVVVGDGELDSQVFATRVAAARAADSAGRQEEARATLRAALGLWRGPAFAGIASTIVESGARRLAEQRLAAWEDCFDLELRLGQERAVVEELTEHVDQLPMRERLRGQLMLALYRDGRQAQALTVYRQGQQALAAELGIDPGPELQELHRRILNRDPSLQGAADPGPPARADGPRCLPRDIADFTGRDDAVQRLLSAVSSSPTASAIVAIDGMAGTGKPNLETGTLSFGTF